jgi:GT2 family glycosyltransferase/SAM-dependent methyltransferase
VKRKKQSALPEIQTSVATSQVASLVFTGERYIPTEQGEIRLEHIHRYSIALDIVAGKVVLDIASGEGYGSNLLSSVAHTVTGIDISGEAVQHARATYSVKNNLMFMQGSATKIDLPDYVFDVVISFETIEHLAEQSKMLSEIRRVLKPTGVLLISSPNRPIYSEASGNHNEFHTKELDFKEFDSLLRKQFKAIQYLGQRLQIGSLVQPLDGAADHFRALSDDGVNIQQTSGELADPVYFLAICAATVAAIPKIDASILQPVKQDLLKKYVGYANWAINSNKELDALRKLHGELNEEHQKVATWAQSLDKQISTVTLALSDRDQQITALSDETVKRGERALGLETQLKAAQADLAHAVADRDSHIARLIQAEKNLYQVSQLNTNLDLEHHKVTTWAQTLDKQVSTVTLALSDRDQQIAALSDEAVKRGEWALGLETQLKSAQAELVRAISERESKIEHLNQAIAEFNDQIAKLKQDLVKADYDLKLREQLHDNELQQISLAFEREKSQLSVVHVEKERTLSKEHAERERVLHERLLTAQADQRKIELKWTEKAAANASLAAQENNKLRDEIKLLQQKIHDAFREQLLLSDASSEKEKALSKEYTEQENVLRERLFNTQSELRNIDQEWAEKSAAQQRELALYQQSSTALQTQMLEQIGIANQIVTQTESDQESLRLEFGSIKSSLAWRFFAPFFKLGSRTISLSPVKAENPKQQKTFDTATAYRANATVPNRSHDTTNRYFEEVRMNNNYVAPTYHPLPEITSLDELLDCNDEAFVWAMYHTLLRRAPDTEGMAYYVKRLRRGISKLQMLDQICRSKEAQACAVKLPGLVDALRRNRWLKLPIIGALLRNQGTNQKLHAIENQLFILNESSGCRFDQIGKGMTSLQQSMMQQAQIAAGAAMIHQLGYSSIDSWRTVEKVFSFEGRGFLEHLFQSALGRMPEVHEVEHYLHILDKGVSKLHVLELIFSCAECKNWLASERVATVEAQSKAMPQAVVNEEQGKPVAIAAQSIHFVEYDKPLVSIVIPVYGKIEYTLMCLKSIQEHLPELVFEIIVVDDKSPDNTVAELSKVRGIKLVTNAENLGFIRSCNHGAEHARGEYLCFLNNDTEVKQGWLDELVRTFHEFPGTGLAGSKFVYPNGSLQEAGGIIWQDGSAWNFGRNQDPSLPIYNYAREVDYCSGASIIVPSALFRELGSFDEHYLPAYCEDSDLALKVRDRGYRVIYQPLSVVVHYEGITSGTDTTHGVKAYQIENSKKLFARWRERLKHHQPNGIDVDNAKDRMAKRRVLVLDHCTPTPNQDAGSVTVFNLLLLLREMDFQVTFIPEDNFLYMPEYTTMLQRIGVEVLYAPYNTSVEQHLVESGSRYALVFLFRPMVVEKHLKIVRKHCLKAKILYHTIDLHHLRMMREANLLNDPAKQKAAKEMKRLEFSAIRTVDASIVHSTSELEILRPALQKEKIHVFPLILNVCGTEKQYRDRKDIVFVGGYQHTPNVDAVQYFVKEVMPLLRRKLPGIRFYAVGSKPPQEILDLAGEDVIITGFVDDLNPFLDKMRIAVAPLRYGAGIKGKIGTAMAAGLPTVATTLAAEGMKLTDGENILIADGAHAFADAIVRLYQEEGLWNRISRNGLEFADSTWGAEAAWIILSAILNELGFSITQSNRQLTLYSPNLSLLDPLRS